MPRIKSIEIRCLRCIKWFRSPIQFGNTESFDTARLFMNLATCPHCGKTTGSSKWNFRMYSESGGLLGTDTVI